MGRILWNGGRGCTASIGIRRFRFVTMRSMTTPHPIHRVRSFQIVAPYALRVQFDDATEQLINFEPVLGGELYRPLRDLAVFNQVRIDPQVHTLIWPNGADFDPATLHDLPRFAEAFAERVRRWEMAACRPGVCQNRNDDPAGVRVGCGGAQRPAAARAHRTALPAPDRGSSRTG